MREHSPHTTTSSQNCTCCRICSLESGKHTDRTGHADHGHHDDTMTHQEHAKQMEHSDHADTMTHHDQADPIDHESSSAHSKHGGQGSHGDHSHMGHEIMFRNRFWINLVLSIPVLIYSPAIQGWFGYTAPVFPGSFLIIPVLSTIIFFYGGLPFLRMATWELRERKPGMMTLISLAISVAYFYSMSTLVWDLGEDFFWELVTLIDIMLLGHWLEMRSVRQASGALDALAQLLPDTAELVLADGSTEEHPASHLKTDDIVLVRPGASVPADGVVVEGESEVDEAMVTGESKPVDKTPDSPVIAGTVNAGNGSLRVKITAVGDDTALSGIMRLVEEAQQSKSETQLLADRAASLLFYAAVAAALIAGTAWTLYFGEVNTQVVAIVVTVLIIACPHALGLAVPLVVANTTALGAENGILIRDRQAMETAKDLNIIVFDKTGTLTKGEIGVVAIATATDQAADEALAVTAAIEGDSEHPIARAIRHSAAEKQLDLPPISGFEILKGRGVKATYDGQTVYVGGPRLLEFLEVERPLNLTQFAEESGEKGQSVVYLVREQALAAAFALADEVRAESATAVTALHDMDIEVAMLTGDSKDVAKAVAEELKIDQVFCRSVTSGQRPKSY